MTNGTGRDGRHAQELARIEAAYEHRTAGGVDSVYRFSNPGYALYMQLLEWALLEALRGSPVDLERARVLDVGSGTGYFAHRLVDFGAQAVTGVDLMSGRVEEAQRRYPGLPFVCANAAELPFPDGQFEIVCQFTLLSSVLDIDLRTAIAAEMWRVTAPGGIVVSFDIRRAPAPLRGLRWLARRRSGAPASWVKASTPTVAVPSAELERLFPGAALRYRSVGLAFELCATAALSEAIPRALAAIPPLREHGLGILVKGQPAS